MSIDRIAGAENPEEYEYVESNSTVKYASTYDGGQIDGYSTMPWDEFLKMKVEEYTVRSVGQLLDSEVGSEPTLQASVDYGRDSFPVIVSLITYTEDGCVTNRPPANFDAVRETAPQSVTVEVSLDGKSRSKALDVGVRSITREPATPA